MELIKFFIINIDKLFEFISFLIAAWAYPYLKHSYMKWFLPFLGFILLAGLASRLFRFGFYGSYLSSVSEVYIYGYVFFKLTTKSSVRKLIAILMSCVVIAYGYSYFFLDADHWFMFYYIKVSMAFSFLITAIALNYLYQEVLIEQKSQFFTRAGVWIAFGVSIFFSGFGLITALYSYILHMNLYVLGIRLYHLIPRLLCVVLYSCLSAAIVLYRKQQQMAYTESIKT
jgi:hypothetical protein